MTFYAFIAQLLNGLTEASALFLVAAGLSLIFGVTRIVNFAHGSFYMLGLYVAYSCTEYLVGHLGPTGFWLGMFISPIIVGLFGALIEILVLRRIYKAPELFQLLGTFALVLIINDMALYLWGPEELLGRRAPGLTNSVDIVGRHIPSYNLFLIVMGPLVLGLMWLLLNKTRWGILIRAATEDRQMLGALGVNQAWLFTAVFALGSMLAGLGGALQLPREPASLTLDLRVIADAFVVVVVGGMGSLPGAWLAALIIAIIKAMCVGIGTVDLFGVTLSLSKLTLVVEFLVMAVVLMVRPWGLLGRPLAVSRNSAPVEAPLRPASNSLRVIALLSVVVLASLPLLETWLPYASVLVQDVLISVLFAVSLHFIMGPGGMHSFGHAAYFGLGAYGAGILIKALTLPMPLAFAMAPLVAGLGALLFGWFCVRLSGVYLAMLTLAFSQIVWSIVFQWEEVTGGSNGLIGVWPAEWLTDTRYYYLTLTLVCLSILLVRRMMFSPFGFALRASRDSALRADAIGMNVKRIQWMAFMVAGMFAGLAGALYIFSKGSISPDSMAVSKSVDGLVMVLLGGVQHLVGPVLGAAVFSVLQDALMRVTDYWRALLGFIVLMLVLLFPSGIAGVADWLGECVKKRKTAGPVTSPQEVRE